MKRRRAPAGTVYLRITIQRTGEAFPAIPVAIGDEICTADEDGPLFSIEVLDSPHEKRRIPRGADASRL